MKNVSDAPGAASTNFERSTRVRAREAADRGNGPALPLASPRHNGGPALEPPHRLQRGRPSICTPEVQDAIMDQLGEGIPLAVIGREPGMPSAPTISRWRRADRKFDEACRFAQQWGYDALAENVFEEVQLNIDRLGCRAARLIFNLRCQKLARQVPRYFGNRGLKC